MINGLGLEAVNLVVIPIITHFPFYSDRLSKLLARRPWPAQLANQNIKQKQ